MRWQGDSGKGNGCIGSSTGARHGGSEAHALDCSRKFDAPGRDYFWEQ